MKFGWFNWNGILIVALLLAPNIVYAVRRRNAGHGRVCRPVLVLEQIGRYGCVALMALPLGVGKFGFMFAAGHIYCTWQTHREAL